MDAILTKVTSLKDNQIRLTIDMNRDDLTVDILDYVDKFLDVRIPDEKEVR